MIFDKERKLFALQQQAKKIQAELRDLEFEGSELGGKVRVMVNGEQKVTSVDIAEELLNPSEKEALERFLKQAISSAITKSQQAASQKMKGIAGEMGLGL